MKKASTMCHVIVCLWIISFATSAFSQEAYKFELMRGS